MRKTPSFKILSQHIPADPTLDVVLIDPFKSWKLREYHGALCTWAQDSVHSINREGVRPILRVSGFDICNVVAKGPDALHRAVVKLRSRIERLQYENESPLSRSGSAKAPRKPGAHGDGTPLPIIFVVHSLGFWVLKGALRSAVLPRQHCFHPTGVVLLDADPKQRPDAEYLARLEAFLDVRAGAQRKALLESLGEIDDGFDRMEQKYSTLSGTTTGVIDDGCPWSLNANVVTWNAWMSPELGHRPPERNSLRHVISQRIGSGKNKALPTLASNKLELTLVDIATGKAGDDVFVKAEEPSTVPTPAPTANDRDQLSLIRTTTADDKEPGALNIKDGAVAARTPSPPAVSRQSSSAGAMDYRTDTTQTSDDDGGGDDNSCAMSIAHFAPETVDTEEIEQTRALARSFSTSGEWSSAHVLFERTLALMKKVDPPPSQIQFIETRMHIAVVLLYQGKYDEATEGLKKLRIDVSKLTSPSGDVPVDVATAKYEVERWDALSKVYSGNYKEAVDDLEQISYDKTRHSQVSRIRLLRDRALANCLLGHHARATDLITKAQTQLDDSRASQKSDEVSLELEAKSFSIKYTEACIDTVWGEYDNALVKTDDAFRGLRHQLGNAHIKTLRSASLGVHLLAYTGRYSRAETQCLKVLQITHQELGQLHPLNLETIEGLVYILRSQSRLTEALETAKSLCDMTDDAMTPNHPQALRARSQLAATHLAVGNYHIAEKEIRKTVLLSREHLGASHPETLRYQAEWAQALCRLGNLEQALALAMRTLSQQRKIYALSQGKTGGDTQSHNIADGSEVPQAQPADFETLNSILDMIHGQGRPSFQRHPALVFTLEVIALIDAKDARRGLDLADSILQAVVKCRRSSLGAKHAETLTAEYELASVIRDYEFVDNRLSYVNKAFYHVWKERCKLFGPSHPETLSAEREVVITDCVRGVWEDGGPAKRKPATDAEAAPPLARSTSNDAADPHNDATPPRSPVGSTGLSRAQWVDVERVSRTLVQLHEPQLGPNHPETLKSLLWLLSVKLLLSGSIEPDTKQTWRQLRARLRQPSVRPQRLIEALRTEERVALIFADQGHFDVGLGILHDVRDAAAAAAAAAADVPAPSEPSGSPTPLTQLRRDVESEMEAMRPHVVAQQERLDKLERAATSAGSADERLEAYRLSKRLFGRHAPRTLAARFAFARALFSSGDEDQQRRALAVASRLRSLVEDRSADDETRQLLVEVPALCEEWTRLLKRRVAGGGDKFLKT